MPDPFARMHERLAARLGAVSTIRGAASLHNIVLERGVAVTGEYGEVVAHRDVAVINLADAPAPGNAVVIDGEAFTLDSLMETNGYVSRWFVR